MARLSHDPIYPMALQVQALCQALRIYRREPGSRRFLFEQSLLWDVVRLGVRLAVKIVDRPLGGWSSRRWLALIRSIG